MNVFVYYSMNCVGNNKRTLRFITGSVSKWTDTSVRDKKIISYSSKLGLLRIIAPLEMIKKEKIPKICYTTAFLWLSEN